MKTITLILLFLFTATLSYGQVYKWVDEKGIVHFTDDITQIPEKYRRAIEEREVKEEKTETKEEAEAAGKELLSRWFVPTDSRAVESDEPVNYRFNFEKWMGERL